ncbi:MAG: helix-turn-helix transcriptional regulator [Candidatus Bathyarchaeota archaeon]|nr:MAG: helix-turn-helix transcriptional regulator [Candidatus Bathyarchaeota archaeon]
MSRDEALVEIVDKTFSLPPKVILGYAELGQAFTSGDLARICDISRSSAKFYLQKMLELRLVTKVPHKRKYQKYANANTFSNWLKDLIKFAVVPLETGGLNLPSEE